MTNDAKALFVRVLDRMVQARWLRRYTFTDGKGFRLEWHTGGAQRAALLRGLASAERLFDSDNAALGFDEVAQSESRLIPGTDAETMPEAVAAFWRECVEELGLQGDAEGLNAMLHIAVDWGF